MLVYVLAVPLYAGLAAAAGERRPGTRAASETSGVHGLWRLDLLMLWLFLLGATALSFGWREVVRSWPFWAVLLLLWPFPARLANTALGSASGGAVLLVLVVLAVVAYGHRPRAGAPAAHRGLTLGWGPCSSVRRPSRTGPRSTPCSPR